MLAITKHGSEIKPMDMEFLGGREAVKIKNP